MVLFLILVAPVTAANILIINGTDSYAVAAATNLEADLSGSNTVTVINTGVPASLAGYTQIYDIRYDDNPSFTSSEMDEYLAWLNAAPGNTLFLIGENALFLARNTKISQFISLAGGGTIDPPHSHAFINETVHAPFNAPDSIDFVTFAAGGLVTSAGTGSFATTQPGGLSGESIYFNQNTLANASTGGLVVVYDVNFLVPEFSAIYNESKFRQNMERFVAMPTVPTVKTIAPSSGPAGGGTPVVITGSAFAGATAVTFGSTAAPSFTLINTTAIAATSPAGTGTVDILVTTSGGTSAPGIADQFTYLAAPTYVPTPAATLDTSGNDDDITTAIPTAPQTQQPRVNLTENVTVNVGGSSAISRAVVTGTGIINLILTGTEKSRPDDGPYPPGTVYQYIDLIPARYGTIAGAEILFSVPQEWLSGHGIAPDTIVLYHRISSGWVALPTRVLATKDGTVYFSATSPGFSLFSITGVTGSPDAAPAPASSVTIMAAETARFTEPVETPVTPLPVAHQTTSVPAPVPEPAASSGSPLMMPVLAITGCIVLIGGGWYVRRWWIRKQNPALFREYD